MTQCPDRAEIEGLVSGRLPPDRLDFLERHADRCGKCRRVLDELFGSGTILPDGPVPEHRPPPSDALKGVMEALQAALRSAADAGGRHRDPYPSLEPTDRPGFLGRIGAYEI